MDERMNRRMMDCLLNGRWNGKMDE